MGELPMRVKALVQEPLIYRGEKVVTLALVDELHQRPEGTAGRNFRTNRRHLILDEDYFDVPYGEWTQDPVTTKFVGTERRNNLLLLAKSGYLMLVKSLTDDLAWQVQRCLVNNYFVAESIRLESAGRIEMAITKLDSKVDRLSQETRDGFNSIVIRRNPTGRTKARHVQSLVARGTRNCPCCATNPILDDDGQPLPCLQWDHWFSRNRAGIHEVWCVCEKCNRSLRAPAFKEGKRLNFEFHQKCVRELGESDKPQQLDFFE